MSDSEVSDFLLLKPLGAGLSGLNPFATPTTPHREQLNLTASSTVHKTLCDEQISELEALCDQGKRIHAAKRYIELTGGSLTEAKNWIDQYEAQGDNREQRTPPEETFLESRKLLMHGNKIQAIKAYRKASGCSLKEAKLAIESMNRSPGEQDEVSDELGDPMVVEQKGCLGSILLISLFAILFYSAAS